MMMRKAALGICGLLLLLGLAAGAEESALRRAHHRRAAHRMLHRRAAKPHPAPKPPPPAAQEEEDLQREFDQAKEDGATPPSSSTGQEVAQAPQGGMLHAALQDLSDSTSIRGQFNEFLARVQQDTDQLQKEVKKKDAQVAELQTTVSDLELRAQAAEGENAANQKRVQQDLEVNEGKYEKQLRRLKAQTAALTQTNLKLVGTNDDLSKDLGDEKARNQRLLAKLQKMANAFMAQQQAVQQMVMVNAQRVAQEAANEEAAAAPQPVAAAEEEQAEGSDAEKEEDGQVAEGGSSAAGSAPPLPPPPMEAAPRAAPAAPRRLSRRMAARGDPPRRVPAPAAHKAAQPRSLAAASHASAPTKKVLPPLPEAPPKESAGSSDEKLDRLRKEIDTMSKNKVEPLEGSSSSTESEPTTGSATQKEPAPGLAALQDVGNMLKDVDGI